MATASATASLPRGLKALRRLFAMQLVDQYSPLLESVNPISCLILVEPSSAFIRQYVHVRGPEIHKESCEGCEWFHEVAASAEVD